MNTVVSSEPRIVALKVTNDSIIAQLADGRTISTPLAWSWRLSDATPEQRNHFEIMGNGQGVHWPDLDEDISAWGMLYGIPARRPKRKVQPPRRKIPEATKRVKVTT
jgi:hypothetical protein